MYKNLKQIFVYLSTTEELPGTQVWFELSDGELFRIKDNIEKSILKQFNNVTYPYTSINWIYTQDKQNDSVFIIITRMFVTFSRKIL